MIDIKKYVEELRQRLDSKRATERFPVCCASRPPSERMSDFSPRRLGWRWNKLAGAKTRKTLAHDSSPTLHIAKRASAAEYRSGV